MLSEHPTVVRRFGDADVVAHGHLHTNGQILVGGKRSKHPLDLLGLRPFPEATWAEIEVALAAATQNRRACLEDHLTLTTGLSIFYGLELLECVGAPHRILWGAGRVTRWPGMWLGVRLDVWLGGWRSRWRPSLASSDVTSQCRAVLAVQRHPV